MKKINFIMSAVFVLLVFGFLSTLFIPFFTFDPPKDYVAPDPEATAAAAEGNEAEAEAADAALVFNADGKVVFTLFDYLLGKTKQVNKFLAEVIEGYQIKRKSYDINAYVTTLAITVGLAITTTISHICSRKNIFTQISSLAYCISAIVCAFTAKILAYGAPIVKTVMIATAIAALVVFLARLLPWYKTRFAKPEVKLGA